MTTHTQCSDMIVLLGVIGKVHIFIGIGGGGSFFKGEGIPSVNQQEMKIL